MKKLKNRPRVIFPFVEAGLGHIMPIQAVHDAFVKKYGDCVDVVATYFFQDSGNKNMKHIENELVKEVKRHNKNRLNGFIQFLLLRIFRTKLSMKYLHEIRYKRGFEASLQYLKSLDADLIFNTHFSTLYYSCCLRYKNLYNGLILTYCPDPVIGLQWDSRGDLIMLSSGNGAKRAQRRFGKEKVVSVPFLIRTQIESYNKGRAYYRSELDIPNNRFTILLADGAYGAGKLRQTVYELIKSDLELTILAVCGKNEKLYQEFLSIVPKSNIIFKPFGFTDKMLMLAASCDLFIGKAGASNLAEPIFFGAPSIVTFCATPIEKWISRHYVNAGCAIKITNIKKAVKQAEEFAREPNLMKKYIEATQSQSRSDGPEIMADIIFKQVMNKIETNV